MAAISQYPIPSFFNPSEVRTIRRIPYQERAEEARNFALEQHIPPVGIDSFRTALVLIDIQNTFCIPEFELFVGGRSGRGAVEDNIRLCRFIYRNLAHLTQIFLTLDTHLPHQIFHETLLINPDGHHPAPMTLISLDDIQRGYWRFNPALSDALQLDPEAGQAHLLHYTRTLQQKGKFQLTIWPYHAMLGGIGHALVPAVEEAVFFHSVARAAQPVFLEKGENPLTEHYSALSPEVLTDAANVPIADRSKKFIEIIRSFDRVILTGQAKSHCVTWTVEDILKDIQEVDPSLVERIYLLEDCTSPVVVPGVLDYTDEADAAFARFQAVGMHVVHSDRSLAEWPGFLPEQ